MVLRLALCLFVVCAPDLRAAVTVVNKGVSGQNTAEGLARFDGDVVALKPAWVLIFFGANDALSEKKFLALAAFKSNLAAMLDKAAAAGIKPVLATVHDSNQEKLLTRHKPSLYAADGGPNAKLARYNDAIRALAADKGVPLADFAAKSKEAGANGSWLGPDGLHLTPEGYKLLAQTFLDAMQPPPADGETVVCFGDSLTFGYGEGMKGEGTADGTPYPAQLKLLLNPAAP
jgi:lysophospholipase L1-like esterase